MGYSVDSDEGVRCARQDGGFTLIESVTASAILVVIAIAVVTTIVTTGSWYAKARARTEATVVANEVMAKILSREAREITVTPNGTWPGKIPATMTVSTGYGSFAAAVTIEPTSSVFLSADNGLKIVTVTAFLAAMANDPAVQVSVTRYSSGWQDNSGSSGHKIDVQAQIQIGQVDVKEAGVRVQLLDATMEKVDSGASGGTELVPGPRYMTEVAGGFAVTNSDGIATFRGVDEGEYFLTCDYRFGSDIRPRYFPTRIYPSASVSRVYEVECLRATVSGRGIPYPTVLRVGAYTGAGVEVLPNTDDPSKYHWAPPKAPYPTIPGLVVYARPIYGGTADQFGTEYPDVSMWPGSTRMTRSGADVAGVYSATANAYGVAVIEIPWMIKPGQKWEIWCYTDKDEQGNPTTGPNVKQVGVTGSWGDDYKKPEYPKTSPTGPSDRDNVAQFTFQAGTTARNP